MNFKSLVKKGAVVVAVTGALVMVSTSVQYKGDLIGGLNDKLAKLESMLGTYSSRYQKDKDTISKLQAEIASLKEQLATSNGDKSDLQAQLKEAENEIAKYQADLTDLAGALGITMNDTMGFDTPEKYNALKSAINDKIDALKANKTENEAELKAVADILGCADTDDISDTVQDLFDYYDEAQAEVTRLEGELEKANELATNLQAELEKANAEIKRLEGIIAQYEEDLEGANDKAQQIIDGKQDEVDEIKAEPSDSDVQGLITCDKCGTKYVNGTEHTCPPAESEKTCESCGAKYTGTEHTCVPEKAEAYTNLSDNAKLFANKGYVKGDIMFFRDVDRYFTPDDKAKKYKGLVTFTRFNNGSSKYLVNTDINLTDNDITALNHWASL